MRKDPKLNLGTIGTVSHATLRPDHLAVAFLEELEELDPDRLTRYFAECEDGGELEEWWEKYSTPLVMDRDKLPEFIDEIVSELCDILNDYAPDFCYFGAHEGDGSDFGFWPDFDRMTDAVLEGEMLRAEGSLPEFAQIVSDHGNVALYRVKLEEVWSCV
jgi:hypothetical protein